MIYIEDAFHNVNTKTIREVSNQNMIGGVSYATDSIHAKYQDNPMIWEIGNWLWVEESLGVAAFFGILFDSDIDTG